MDMDGRPEGRRVRINEDSSSYTGVHHDPLNEHYEETWSALGDQDERSTGSDPGMLPPPMPVLPATLGTILGRPRTSMQLEDSAGSLYNAPANMRKGEEAKSLWGRLKEREGWLAPTETDKKRHSSGGLNFRGNKENSSEEEEGSSTTRGQSFGSANEEGTNSNEESDIMNSEELDRFFKTMYTTTKRMSLLKQIGVRREIRQLVLNAEKEEQAAARKKKRKSSKVSKH